MQAIANQLYSSLDLKTFWGHHMMAMTLWHFPPPDSRDQMQRSNCYIILAFIIWPLEPETDMSLDSLN